jgi:hypothetical protein
MENIPNKAMQKETVKTKESYFFAGGGEYEPIAIEANNLVEATKEYNKIKKLINK